MHYFRYHNRELYAEDVPLSVIAKELGTPTYVYSKATFVRHFRAFDHSFEGLNHYVCFSVKACSNIAILRLLANLGSGFDVVSGGELFRVLKAGGDSGKVVFSGVGKTEEELNYALRNDILLFNVESAQELELLDRVAKKQGKKARVSIRVNPDVDPNTHPHIATGLKENKFGIPAKEALKLYKNWKSYESLEMVGLDCHIGSQVTVVTPFVDALKKLLDIIQELREYGLRIHYIDLGGGLGIVYHNEKPPLPKDYANEIFELVKGMDCTLILEPGRIIAGNSGIILTKVLYLKESENKKFIVVDAGMKDLIRPALYGAYHQILPVIEKEVDRNYIVDVVGPICESGDFLAKDRAMPRLEQGELVAVMSAGAYGFVMASNYNSHPLPAEVLVNGSDFYLIRERESYDDLIRGERIPEFLLEGKDE